MGNAPSSCAPNCDDVLVPTDSVGTILLIPSKETRHGEDLAVLPCSVSYLVWNRAGPAEQRQGLEDAAHDLVEVGHQILAADGRPLAALPADPALRPSPEVLEWHRDRVFLG